MKIIIPCAGRSTRYPNMPPKWSLPDHEGVPMIVRAVQELNFAPEDVVVTVLKEHEEKFSVRKGLREAFGHPVHTVILEEQTKSQSETVVETLRRAKIEEPFLIKDSDNSFHIDHIQASTNYVTVASLNDFDMINPRNKSYVTIDQEGFITSIREKRVISDLFSVGGYFFRSPEMFIRAYETLSNSNEFSASEIYVSEVISYQMLNGEPFKIQRAKNYQDWGTVHEWRRKLDGRKLFFVSVDGFLFERGSATFSPGFDEVQPNVDAITSTQELVKAGHQLIYLSIRPQEMEAMTRAALEANGLPKSRLLMGCDLAQWTLVTSPHASIPYVTSRARELSPHDENLLEKLIGTN